MIHTTMPSRSPRPWKTPALAAALAVAVAGVAAELTPPARGDLDQRLQQRLKKFPEADANGDGVLTEKEARDFQKILKQRKAGSGPAGERRETPPTASNVEYGPHSRNLLDLWRPAGAGPFPALVFFHGGSFKAGDKSSVLSRSIFAECLQAGIAVVSVNYRFSSDAPFPAPMHDGARAVQFVRAKARTWNLDPARIAVSGSSAGATLALWIALHEDLADPANQDSIARLSTRVVGACTHSGTAGLEPDYFQRYAGVAKLGAAIFQLFGTTSRAGLDAPDKRTLMRDASPLHHATADDPPLFLTYAGSPAEAPFAPDTAQSAWIHHVSLGIPLQARYAELGIECALHHHASPAPAGAEIAFLKKVLAPDPR